MPILSMLMEEFAYVPHLARTHLITPSLFCFLYPECISLSVCNLNNDLSGYTSCYKSALPNSITHLICHHNLLHVSFSTLSFLPFIYLFIFPPGRGNCQHPLFRQAAVGGYKSDYEDKWKYRTKLHAALTVQLKHLLRLTVWVWLYFPPLNEMFRCFVFSHAVFKRVCFKTRVHGNVFQNRISIYKQILTHMRVKKTS